VARVGSAAGLPSAAGCETVFVRFEEGGDVLLASGSAAAKSAALKVTKSALMRSLDHEGGLVVLEVFGEDLSRG
jgi:hypothetical protein